MMFKDLNMKHIKIAVAGILAILSIHAQAALYTYKVNPSTGGALAGEIDFISTSYDDMSSLFTWDTMLKSGSVVDGFWLVVNNGPNPKKSNVNELAIMYGDLDTGTLSTYFYNGANNANSINNPAILLQTDSFFVGSDMFSISINTNTINSWVSPDPDYKGVQFDENIGIWFHFSSGSNFTYNGNGDIVGYSFSKQGWHDVANRDALTLQTSTVSTPGMLSLALLGLLCLMVKRKNR